MKVNLPRYEKHERLCLSLGTSDYLRTVGVTSVLAHCMVIHSGIVKSHLMGLHDSCADKWRYPHDRHGDSQCHKLELKSSAPTYI